MRALVAYGSKRGGTVGLAEMLASELEDHGFEVDVMPARDVKEVGAYDTVVVGGALYANRRHKRARRFVKRHRTGLTRKRIWLFSSGPLDDSALTDQIPPVAHVRKAMEQIGVEGHITFGGRLLPDAKGFPASATVKEHAGRLAGPGPGTGVGKADQRGDLRLAE